MKFFSAQNNFTSGEWSPKMTARTDVDQYKNACERLFNANVQIQGGAFRRPGTKYINVGIHQTSLNASASVKIIPYKVSHGYYALVCLEATFTEWFVINMTTQATYAISLAEGMMNPGDIMYPSTIQYTQIGDYLFIVGSGHWPMVFFKESGSGPGKMYSWLSRRPNFDDIDGMDLHLGYRGWEMVPYGLFNDNSTEGSIVLSTTTATVGTAVTVTFPKDKFYSGTNTFRFPKYVRVNSGGKTAIISLFQSTTERIASGEYVYNPNSLTNPNTTVGDATGEAWELSVWDEQLGGFPSCVGAFEQRLYFSGCFSAPLTLWGSQSGNLFYFMRVPYLHASDFTTFSSDNSRAWEVTIASSGSSAIKSLSAAKSLIANMSEGEGVLYAASGGGLGPLNVGIDISTSFGSADVQALRVNNYLTFVQKDGRKLRDLVFSYEQEQYKSNDLTFIADHLTFFNNHIDEIEEICKVEDPSSILYCRTSSGRILCLTLDREYQVNAWSEMMVSGSQTEAIVKYGNHAKVKAIGANRKVGSSGSFIPSSDVLVLAVARTVGGDEVTYIEFLENIYEASSLKPWEDGLFCLYMDSSAYVLVDGGLGGTSATGFDHLEGETLQVFADGLFIGEKTVTGGAIALGGTYVNVWAGLKYNTIIRPLAIETGTQLGSSLGITKRIDEVTIKFWNSYGCKYGVPGKPAIEIDFRTSGAIPNEAVDLYTGDKRVQFDATYERASKVEITQDKPFPCNVLAIVSRGTTYD